MKIRHLVTVLIASCAGAVPCPAQVLVEDLDICAEHLVSTPIVDDLTGGGIAKIRAEISGDFVGGEAMVSAEEYVYQFGKVLVAVYPYGQTFLEGVYAIFTFREDGPVARQAVLLDRHGEQDYSSLLGTWATIDALLYNGLIQMAPVITPACMDQARIELFVEESVPAAGTTMSRIKSMYR